MTMMMILMMITIIRMIAILLVVLLLVLAFLVPFPGPLVQALLSWSGLLNCRGLLNFRALTQWPQATQLPRATEGVLEIVHPPGSLGDPPWNGQGRGPNDMTRKTKFKRNRKRSERILSHADGSADF